MGIFDFFKTQKKKDNMNYAKMLNGYTPIFTQFGQDVYASDVVQQAIACIVSECVKLVPTHVRKFNNDVEPINDNIQQVLNYPNETMTTSELIEKIVWNLMLNYNSWVIPTYYTKDGKRTYTGLYPVQPTTIDFLQDASDKLWVKLTFANGYNTTLPYSDVIHIKHHFSVNDFLGGNEQGKPDNESLLKTLQINKDLLEGVSHAMKSSFAINGVVKYNAIMDGGKTEKAIKELEELLKSNESGFLPLDMKGEFIPISKQIQMVDSTTLKFIDEKILRHMGVPLPILTGDYSKSQYEAFFQKTIEPLIRHLSQAFSKTLFTQNEYQGYGHRIEFYNNALIFMTIDQVNEMVRLLGDSGSIYENEKRVAYGLPPLKELIGVRMQSLNYIDANVANTYQVKQKEE